MVMISTDLDKVLHLGIDTFSALKTICLRSSLLKKLALATISCKSTGDTVPYFGINGLFGNGKTHNILVF